MNRTREEREIERRNRELVFKETRNDMAKSVVLKGNAENLDTFFRVTESIDGSLTECFKQACLKQSAAIAEVFVRHAVKHKIDVNGVLIADDNDLLCELVSDARQDGRHEVLQELMLSLDFKIPVTSTTFMVPSLSSLPCLLLLLEENAVNVADSPAVIWHLVTKALYDEEDSMHKLHEWLRAGANPFYRNHLGMSLLDLCDSAEKPTYAIDSKTNKVIDISPPENRRIHTMMKSFMNDKPIRQRRVENIIVDEEGRTIRHRFYADYTDETHIPPNIFEKYMNSLKVKDMRIMPNGKSRITFTFTKDIGDGKSRPRGMFTSRVIPPVSIFSADNQIIGLCLLAESCWNFLCNCEWM